MYGGNCPGWIFLPVRCHFFKTLMAVLSKNLIITVGGWVHCHWCQKRPLDGAALTQILHCSCKQFMKKGRGRVTKSFRTWDKHKGKVTEGFHTISRTKKKIIKRGKCRGKPWITHIHRWFSGRKPEVTGPKLTFSECRRHGWPGQPIEKSVGM